MYSHPNATCGAGRAVAVGKEGFVVFAVGAGEGEDLGADEEAFGGDVNADFFVAAAEGLHIDLTGGQVDLDIEVSLLADEVFFFYADRGNDESDTGAADVGRLAVDARRARFVKSTVGGSVGFKPYLDRCTVATTRGHQTFR